MRNDYIKLVISKYEDYYYYFIDNSNNKEYKFMLELVNTGFSPEIGDSLFISRKLLDKNYSEYSNMYSFGPTDSSFGRKIDKTNMHDVIIYIRDNKEIYLKRYYG